MNALFFENVSFGYTKQTTIFNEISFKLQLQDPSKGHIVALMGNSGSGKSTILKLILGMLSPTSGKIWTEKNRPIISYQPQDGVLFEHLNPNQNARYFEQIDGYKNLFDANLFDNLNVKLGMDTVLKTAKSVSELSGGQRQRLALLRALSIRPNFLLLDEPTTGMDSSAKIQFLNELRRIVVEQKILTVYVTHHKEEAELCADEVLYIHKNISLNKHEIFQRNINDFIETPPILDAARVFNYPTPNILKCAFSAGCIVLQNTLENSYFLSFNNKHITFSEQVGFEFELITSTTMFTIIKLSSGDFLTIPTMNINNGKNVKLLLTGTMNLFDKKEKFLKKIKILNNTIVS